MVISSPASTGISQSVYATGNTTQSTSGTSPIGSLLVQGAGNVSAGFSNGSLVISGATAAGLTTGGIYVAGNTTGQSSSSTYVLTQFNVSAVGMSEGWSSNSLILSAGAGGGGGVGLGISNLGNTAGTSGTVTTGNVVLVGSGAISLSQSSSGSNATISILAPATSSLSATGNASLSVNASTISIGANAAAISIGGNSTSAGAGYSNISTGTAVFMGGPNITLSQNGASISISAGAGGGGTQASFFALGNTTQNSSSVLPFSALSFNAIGELSAGFSNGSIQLSSPPQSIGVSTGGNTAGNTGTYSGQVIFAGGNNITLSVGTAAGGAQTITISGANAGGAQTGISGIIVSNTTYTSGTVSFSNANGISFGSSAGQAITASYTVPTQTAQTVGIYASSQTTASASSYTFDARSLSVIGAGGISIGLNSTSAGGTTTGFIISAPAVSSLSNSNNVSFGTNGSTITASYALNVSAGGGTSNALSAITFSNSNGMTFGLSTGAGVGTMTASVQFDPVCRHCYRDYRQGAHYAQ